MPGERTLGDLQKYGPLGSAWEERERLVAAFEREDLLQRELDRAESRAASLREALEEIAGRESVTMRGEGSDRIGVLRSYSEAVEIARAVLDRTEQEKPAGLTLDRSTASGTIPGVNVDAPAARERSGADTRRCP